MSPEPISFKCPACGAPVKLDHPGAVATCAFCGVTVELPPEPGPAPREAGTPPRPGAVPAQRRARPLFWIGVVAIILIIKAAVTTGRFRMHGPVPAPPGTRPQVRNAGGTGARGADPGRFQGLAAFAVDNAGNVFAAGFQAPRIQKFGSDGQFLLAWAIGDAIAPAFRNRGPSALAADAQGFVYAACGDSLLKFAGANGNLVAHFHLEQFPVNRMVVFRDTILAFPDARGRDDTLVWLSTRDGRVLRRTPALLSKVEGEPLVVAAMKLAVDRQGAISVLYTFPGRHMGIYRFTAEGRPRDRISLDPDPGRPVEPAGDLAVDARGRLYVSRNSRIDRFGPDGHPLGAIPFDQVRCAQAPLLCDGQDRLLVLDRGRGEIRKIEVP